MKRGIILVNALVFGAVSAIVISGLVSYGTGVVRSSRQLVGREQAFHIAEAGIDYYRWHLAHAPTDYYDGNATTTSPGPYTHPFYDKDNSQIGEYRLTITPPPVGSTVVRIRSEGVYFDPAGNISRAIQVSLAIPSLAKYAVAANNVMRFGQGTEVFGPIHSNDGIRFDGVAHNLITSAKSTYTDTDSDACTTHSWAVHTCVNPDDPTPPTAIPNRPDVFGVGRSFPVPTIDFAGMTTDLSQIKASAQSAGRYFAPSGFQGYRILLKTNDTFEIYRVTGLTTVNGTCSNSASQAAEQDGWGTWSVRTQIYLGTYAIPANGLIFVEDHVWVEGTVNTARVTIASARFPDSTSTRTSITVNNPLRYTNTDGTDSIALIAQNNMNVGLVSSSTMQIDAAIIAQNGRVGRYYYNSSCTNYLRTALTLYGMIATNKRYGFAYGNVVSGYTTRNIVYDGNLLYSPPPSFPLTSNQYQVVSWDEVR